MLNKTEDFVRYTNRSLVRLYLFLSLGSMTFHSSVSYFGDRTIKTYGIPVSQATALKVHQLQFQSQPQSSSNILDLIILLGFAQKRFPNGTFAFTDPADCSPNDSNDSRDCSLQGDNVVGFYESSSWEYSWFAPHDTAHLITLMGGNVRENFYSSLYLCVSLLIFGTLFCFDRAPLSRDLIISSM